MGFQDIGAIYQLLEQYHTERMFEEFGDGVDAKVALVVRVDVGQAEALQEAATNATSGRAAVTMLA